MDFCIHKLSDETVVLMTESGHVLSFFGSVNEALDSCYQRDYLNTGTLKHHVKIYHTDMKNNSQVANHVS